ncbi:MAG: hydrogenase nickel incorporation protein HypB [Proteobacteria bacterium]|nr:hydrogenase nickel incorporation protein HypB [Pseudomonadota bacterium]
MCDTCGCAITDDVLEEKILTVELLEDLMLENNRQAESNRQHLDKEGVFCINLMSSPGSGKTTLLERTIDALSGKVKIGVIEGDLETENDAQRIRAKGAPAFQITTGTACHLDAKMVHRGLHHLPLNELDLVFIENIGNLVCPAAYALGEHINVTLLAVTEGDDKAMKYPVIFRAADMVIITKTDLLPYCDFDVQKAEKSIKLLNPKAQVLMLGKGDEKGLDEWIDFCAKKIVK